MNQALYFKFAHALSPSPPTSQQLTRPLVDADRDSLMGMFYVNIC